MREIPLFVGVDGCRAGWLAVTHDAAGFGFQVFRTMEDLVLALSDAALILVDMPIGLPSSSHPYRQCERDARKLLGSRASSVFSTPCRNAVHASDIDAARLANINEMAKSLSAQSWGICSKIAEVDRFLCKAGSPLQPIREVHPEVCFWGLNGKKAMPHSKKTPMGLQERIEVLRRVGSGTDDLIAHVKRSYRRNAVQVDDILDALVACITAMASLNSELLRLGEIGEFDDRGLPMEMVYALANV